MTKRKITQGEATWQEIAERLSEIAGHSVSHQSACAAGLRLLAKLRVELIKIPEVKEWVEANDIDVEKQ